jgi:hypothetical protein
MTRRLQTRAVRASLQTAPNTLDARGTCSSRFVLFVVSGVILRTSVYLQYANAGAEPGLLVISAGHWIELTHLDTSVEFVVKAMEQQYGAAAAAQFMNEYQSSDPISQQAQVQQSAQRMVQSSANVKYGNLSKK